MGRGYYPRGYRSTLSQGAPQLDPYISLLDDYAKVKVALTTLVNAIDEKDPDKVRTALEAARSHTR